jgi:hypothetical protein
LEYVVPPDAVERVAVAPDGRRIALAFPVESGGRSSRSRVEVRGEDPEGTVVVQINGRVRDLIYVGTDRLYAVVHRPAKRGEGASDLVRIDIDSGKARPEMRLPPSARALEHRPLERSLLVAVRDEIRSVVLSPRVRSGPLYRLPGENLALALLDDRRLVVAQDAALLVIDLNAPQTRSGTPVRDRLPCPTPIVALSAGADEGTALAGLADGRVATVGSDPLSLTDAGRGIVVRWRPPGAPPPVPPPRPSPPATQPPPGDAVPEGTAPQVERPAPLVPPVDATPVEPVTADRPPPAPEPSEPAVAPPTRAESRSAPPSLPRPPTEVEDAAPVPPAAEPPPAHRGGEPHPGTQILVRITGPAAREVLHVVLLGPDNLLREAARLEPDPGGRFEISGLAAGRYTIQLDAGGGRVLSSEPPFHTVVLPGDGPIVADFRVLRAY